MIKNILGWLPNFSANNLMKYRKFGVNIIQENQVPLLIRGLPLQASQSQILNVFKEIEYIPNSMKFSHDRKNCAIIVNKEDMEKVLALHGYILLSRYLEILPLSNEDYLKFNKLNTYGLLSPNRLEAQITAVQKSRALWLSGIPFSCTEGQIKDLFEEFTLELVVFELKKKNLRTGRAVAVFDGEKNMREACLKHNLKYIGDRYVELAPYI